MTSSRGFGALCAVGLSLCAMFACGGGDNGPSQGGTGGGGGTGVTISAECKAFAEARCDKENSCAPYRFGRSYLDAAVCKDGFARVCQDRMQAPDSGWTASAVSACASDFANLSCTLYMNFDYPSSCEFHGNRADGAGCGTDGQCKSGFCVLDNEAWAFVDDLNVGCGHCAPTPPRAGEKCDWAGKRQCFPVLSVVCEGNAVCTKLLPDGSSCGGNDCYGTSLCSNGSGTCIPQFSQGQDCLQTAEASLHGDLGCNFDVQGLMCNKDTFKCEPGPVLAGEGDACDPLQLPCGPGKICVSSPTTCGADLHCDGSSKVCVQYPGLGKPCVDQFGAQIDCRWPFTCRPSGVCELFDASTCN